MPDQNTKHPDIPRQDRWLACLEEALVDRRAQVERTAAGLEVSVGRSITAASAAVDPDPLWEVLDDVDPDQQARLIAGYASGVHHVLLEPKRSDAADWGFEEAAGRLVPNLEVHTFELGARAAGQAAWTRQFHQDLVVGYFIELDVGVRVLTQDQFDRWSAPAGRVTAAGRSLLYHKSRNARPQPVDEFDGVECIHLGDTYDAVRCIVVADLFFAEFDDSFRCSMPSQDALLFTRGHSDDDLAALEAATAAQWQAADYPISASIYAFENGQPVLQAPRNQP